MFAPDQTGDLRQVTREIRCHRARACRGRPLSYPSRMRSPPVSSPSIARSVEHRCRPWDTPSAPLIPPCTPLAGNSLRARRNSVLRLTETAQTRQGMKAKIGGTFVPQRYRRISRPADPAPRKSCRSHHAAWLSSRKRPSGISIGNSIESNVAVNCRNWIACKVSSRARCR